MAKGLHFGIGEKAHKVKKMYIGIAGKARKVKKAYIGVGGMARLFFSANPTKGLYRATGAKTFARLDPDTGAQLANITVGIDSSYNANSTYLQQFSGTAKHMFWVGYQTASKAYNGQACYPIVAFEIDSDSGAVIRSNVTGTDLNAAAQGLQPVGYTTQTNKICTAGNASEIWWTQISENNSLLSRRNDSVQLFNAETGAFIRESGGNGAFFTKYHGDRVCFGLTKAFFAKQYYEQDDDGGTYSSYALSWDTFARATIPIKNVSGGFRSGDYTNDAVYGVRTYGNYAIAKYDPSTFAVVSTLPANGLTGGIFTVK